MNIWIKNYILASCFEQKSIGQCFRLFSRNRKIVGIVFHVWVWDVEDSFFFVRISLRFFSSASCFVSVNFNPVLIGATQFLCGCCCCSIYWICGIPMTKFHVERGPESESSVALYCFNIYQIENDSLHTLNGAAHHERTSTTSTQCRVHSVK